MNTIESAPLADTLDSRALGSLGAEMRGFDIAHDLNDVTFPQIEKIFYDAHLLVVQIGRAHV